MKSAARFSKQRHARVKPYSKSIWVPVIIWILMASVIHAQSTSESTASENAEKTTAGATLVHAAMCEKIKDYSPYNEAIVFSISTGRISCFSSFEHIPEKMFIYHKWYRKDKLTAKKKLTLNPPRWATFSSMQLREADKGPWRVEIAHPNGTILTVLRFSITD